MEDKLKASDTDQLTDVEVGEILRRARVHYGQSLHDVERILRIRGSQLEAIEKGDVSKLPGRVYAIGFVRTYAEYLGLDGDKVVHLFKAQYMDPQPRAVLTFPVPASETKIPPVWLAVVSVMMLIFAFTGWNIWEGKRQVDVSQIDPLPKDIEERITEKVEIAPEPKATATAVQGPPVTSAVTENATATPSEAHKGIILNIKNNSWVEIKDGAGKMIVSDVLKKGDQYFVPDSPGLTMSLGNAGGIEIVLNGKTLMPLGKEGDVLRNIPLDTAHLKKLEFAPQEESKAPAQSNNAAQPPESVQN